VNPPPSTGRDDPRIIGYVFTALGGVLVVLAAAVTIVEFLVARYLKQRQHRTFCMVVAGFNCLWVPVGTALGVCTFLVLQRPTVKTLFGEAPSVPASPPPPLPPHAV